MNRFLERLSAPVPGQNPYLCIGLDPDPAKIPAPFSGSIAGIGDFLVGVIEATRDLAMVYKPNISFFEALGVEGLQLLWRLRNRFPNLIWIIDAKRGDIGNTSAMQAKFLYDHLGADAVTLHPYMGLDSLSPFFDYSDRFSFVLALTSNPGAADFEMVPMQSGQNFYQTVAKTCETWHHQYGNVGLVVGATHLSGLTELRSLVPDLLFLMPGVGAQGADFSQTVEAGQTPNGLVLVNASRAILYPTRTCGDIFESVRLAAQSCK